ncbi:DEAD/DEAH box helicase [Macrococcus brunensis]|uniref:DEAD/DEAH box helicase n=1 Tax=Macrococcus brunensis TaxID=198483 RepID=UPI001EF05EF5|nr:DEAD/DEAH box helicase [Macrococcus brunensis]ULG73697.1 DEAD/DEAH box helicase [Macrococcus brunensis]
MKALNQNKYLNYLEDSIKHGFINHIDYQNSLYAPKLLLNSSETGKYVLNDIQNELNKSISFCINVAFVTKGGIAMLKSQILDFAKRGGTGKLLISPYLGFNDPDALKELLKLPNVDVRLANEKINSHAKIYIFNQEVDNVVIIGSSNLTHNALKINYEMNLKLSSSEDGDYIRQVQQAFDSIWNESKVLTNQLITMYEEENYRKNILATELIRETKTEELEIMPNKMQLEALEGIRQIREKGSKKALVISSTGTGKTFLSAFDVKDYAPSRFLFIVHREQILKKAIFDYQRVIGFKDEEACIYRSKMDVSNKKYIFATIQSLSKKSNLSSFDPQFFDYILIDEVHKAGANSYLSLMDYFNPKFILGMTATPERTDDKNIYELFDFNLAYEIRLQKALEEDILCPFLYFGVSDISINGDILDEKIKINDLIAEERVDHILEKAEYYGHSGKSLKGLIFCSSKDEAKELSNLLNKRKYKTVALTGDNTQDFREECVKNLEEGSLDYILTVDIFNEGIDIPSINQIIMLRNTESSIVFIQQLGRGLRKHNSKEYVTIIDFIGNYRNNYIIPLALYGDNSMNRDNYRRDLINKTQLAGVTTINFEEVAKKQIFDSIKQTNFSKLSMYKEIFIDLKNRLGRTPLLKDFLEHDSLDPLVLFVKGTINYTDVLRKFKDDSYEIEDASANNLLSFVSNELLNGKRPHELILLKLLTENKSYISKRMYLDYLDTHQIHYDEKVLKSVERVLNLEFFKKSDRKKYGDHLIKIKNNYYEFDSEIKQAFNNKDFHALLKDVIEAGLIRSKKYPAGYTNKLLQLGEKYSRKDACRLLCWDNDESSTMYGYITKHHTTPIFVTYHKSVNISESTKYEDRFINEQIFHWFTRPKRNLESSEVKRIIEHKKEDINNYLFVKKEDAESSEFYYLGKIDYIEGSAYNSQIQTDKGNLPIVQMDFRLEKAVPYEIYHYLTEK